jgi:hypothetical protein
MPTSTYTLMARIETNLPIILDILQGGKRLGSEF